MSNRASAARYAKALFDVALKDGDPSRVDRDLTAFASLVEGHDELRRMLLHPALPAPAKRGVIDRLLEKVDVDTLVVRLLALLAERDRLELLPDLAEFYRERVMEHQHVIRAEIVTAIPLPQDRAEQFQRRLSDVTGRTVVMDARVDPSIIGGVIAKVGGTVYDGSVASQLTKMRNTLVEGM